MPIWGAWERLARAKMPAQRLPSDRKLQVDAPAGHFSSTTPERIAAVPFWRPRLLRDRDTPIRSPGFFRVSGMSQSSVGVDVQSAGILQPKRFK